jgi:hypothetical protein
MSDLFENFWKITKLDCKTIQVIQNPYVSIQIICECKNLHLTTMDCSCIQNGGSHNYIQVNKQLILTPCHQATQKCVITVPCVVDGSWISAFFYATSCTCVCHSVWLTYHFNVIASLMQDAWVSSYKQTDWS